MSDPHVALSKASDSFPYQRRQGTQPRSAIFLTAQPQAYRLATFKNLHTKYCHFVPLHCQSAPAAVIKARSFAFVVFQVMKFQQMSKLSPLAHPQYMVIAFLRKDPIQFPEFAHGRVNVHVKTSV